MRIIHKWKLILPAIIYVLFIYQIMTYLTHIAETGGERSVTIAVMTDRQQSEKRIKSDTYWENYYQKLINKTKIVHVPPYNLQRSEPCKGEFSHRMEDNMQTVLNYPVIGNMKKKYPKLSETFERPVTNGDKNITSPIIVTGASEFHYFKSLAMVKSVKEKLFPIYPQLKLIYFDLGLTSTQLKQLKQFCNCEIRKFPFRDYPQFVSELRSYVWKPIIIYLMLKEYNFVMWVDASLNFNGNIPATKNFFHTAKNTGILLTRLGDESRSFYHTKEDTFKFLNETPCLFEFHQTEATYITVWKTDFTWKYIIQPWLACALTENCMSHSDPLSVLWCRKRNKTLFHWCHRFDQSVLSIILQRLFHVNYDIIALNRLPRIGKIKRNQFLILPDKGVRYSKE